MRGRIFSEADVADEDDRRLGKKDERDQKPVLREDGLAQAPRDGEDEQVINHVRDAVVAAERGRGHAETPREDAVINIRKRGGDEDGQINPARNIRQRASQGDWAEQQPQGGEREWKVAFHPANQSTKNKYTKSKTVNTSTIPTHNLIVALTGALLNRIKIITGKNAQNV